MKAKYFIILILIVALATVVATPAARAELVTLAVIRAAAFAPAILGKEAAICENKR
jgi:hypothetical protein